MIKRKELAGKLSAREAIIQAGLDSGWACFLASGTERLEQLSQSEQDYLHKSATSYYLAGDPVIQDRVKQYCRA